MKDVPCSYEGSRHSTHNIDHPKGLHVDVQADSHQQQQSSAHLSGNESNNAHVIVPSGGIPMTLHQQDLVNRSAPASFLPPEVPTDPPPSGQSNMENVPCPSW